MLLTCITLCATSTLLAQAETEPNDVFAQANPIAVGVILTGNIGSGPVGSVDQDDWFRAVLPKGGSFELFLEATARTGSGNANFFATIYRGNGVNSLGSIAKYSIAQGVTTRDTFRIFGRASGDTIYVRMQQSAGSFDYALRYTNLEPTVAPDQEPNDVAAQSLTLVPTQTARGQIGYTLNATTDGADWYRTVLPQGGSFELFVEGKATSGGG